MDLRLDDKTALVSGAHRGTGSEIARELAREGAHVLVHGFEEGQAAHVVDDIRAAGGRAHEVFGEIRRDEGAHAVHDQVATLASRVDVLVNNYGVAEGGGWFRSDTADWVDQYQKNVLSAVRLVEAFVPAMKANGWGRIIFLSTIGATRPAARMAHYYAAKTALVSASVSLAQRLAETGITVNTVSPGLIATDEVRAMLEQTADRDGIAGSDEARERAAIARIAPNPIGRAARTEEVAALVAFLASDRAGYIHGQNLRIDGGAVGIV
jgi:NAD(P)-dependent dehydrogenase (short-subunit alcohol dehydrogenase family)